MLCAVLTRRYAVQPEGNSRSSLLTSEVIQRIHDLHREGKGPVEIAAIVGVSRKQVARVLAEPKPTDADSQKPIPRPDETFRGKTGDTA
jgi:hypothetical protein